MDSTALTIGIGFLAGGAVVWLLMQVRTWARQLDLIGRQLAETQAQLAQTQTELARTQERLAQAQAEKPADPRILANNVKKLMELTAQDNLDALWQVSHEAVRRVVRKIAPHLVEKDSEK